jgi:hypothetical protein
MRALGIVLLVIGILMTVFTGFNLVSKEKVLDVGSVEIQKEEKTPIYWSPITGGVLILAGVVVLIVGKGKKFMD